MRGSGRARCWECHCEDSSSLEQAGPPGEATRRSLGAEFCLRSWGSSWLKLENRFEVLCSTLYFYGGRTVGSTTGRVLCSGPGGLLSHLLSLHGAVARGLLLSYPMFTGGEISEIAAAPPLPCAVRPLGCPSALSAPPPLTASRVVQAPPCSVPPAPQPPPAAPPWPCPSVFPAPENLPLGPRSLEVCNAPPSGMGGEGDIIRKIPTLRWARRGVLCSGPVLGTAPSPREAALSPTPLPNPSGRDGPRPSAWPGASSLRNVVVGAGD